MSFFTASRSTVVAPFSLEHETISKVEQAIKIADLNFRIIIFDLGERFWEGSLYLLDGSFYEGTQPVVFNVIFIFSGYSPTQT